MRIELLKIWVLGRSRFQVRLVDGAGHLVKLLADDVAYFGALDVVVRWKARQRSPLVPVALVGRNRSMVLNRPASSNRPHGSIPPSPDTNFDLRGVRRTIPPVVESVAVLQKMRRSEPAAFGMPRATSGRVPLANSVPPLA